MFLNKLSIDDDQPQNLAGLVTNPSSKLVWQKCTRSIGKIQIEHLVLSPAFKSSENPENENMKNTGRILSMGSSNRHWPNYILNHFKPV